MSAVAKRPAPATQVKRAHIVSLILAGRSQLSIAEELGVDEGTVRYHKQGWLEAQAPSVEQTEELRQVQSAQIDALTAKLSHVVDRFVFDEEGNHLLHPLTGEPIKTADVQVVDRLVKLMDRKARLMGLDLQQNVQVNVLPTAEQLAALFGWDATVVIEGTAVEEVVDG